MYRFRALPVILVAVLLLSSCSLFKKKKGDSEVSSTTGWRYNDPDNGGFEVAVGADQKTGPGLVLIEGGVFRMGRVQQDVMFDWNNVPRTVTVSSFYMDETEVKNVDYREYLYWLRRVYQASPEVYRNHLPDTLVWRSPAGFNDPYVEYYFRHPSYNNYPVVGVSWVKASDYCLWRTDRVNEQILIDEGELNFDPNQLNENNFNTEAYLARLYDGAVNDKGLRPDLSGANTTRKTNFEDGILLPRYRLPTEAEWEFAAYALKGNTFEERVYERRIYPWDGHNVRNSSQKYRGEMMANFVRARGDYMGVAGSLNDNGAITVDVKSYWPNDYGLYCMAGNVNEWVLDVYRPLSSTDVDEFNPFRGNVYTDLKRDANGNVVQKDKLGRLFIDTVKPKDVAQRYNYRKGDYRNYKDGDQKSSLDQIEWSAQLEDKETSTRMYPQDAGAMDYNSLINDNARVYKGGSWKDRAYWLNPSSRRFLDQNESRDDLGFRCAMIRVGSPSGL